MRFKSFCFYFLLSTCCALFPFELSSSPSTSILVLWFSDWKVGQGASRSDTFITNTETTCDIEATVSFDGDWPFLNEHVSWEVEMSDGFTVVSSEKGWRKTGYHFQATLNGNPGSGPAACTRQPSWRERGTGMKVKIKFIVNYSTGPIEMATKTITQDPTDQIRQEYLDMDRLVPSRLEFIDTNEYNNGHYDKMIDGGLARHRQDWVTTCNERNGTSFTTTDFHLNSGYRNPHHNDYHAGSSATHSLHQYGVALDVQTVDVDGDGTVEQVKPSYKKIMTDAERIAEKTRAEGLSADAIEMGLSALAAGANKTWHYTAYDNHTHADWRNDYRTPWPPSINTSGQLLSEAPELPSSVVYACSFHSGAQTLSDNHEQVTPSCNRSEHANYQCQLTFSDHALQTSCSVTNSDGDYCTATYFYLCDSHTHEYPSSSLAACGIHPASASGDHTSTYVCDISPCSNRVVPYCLALCPETSSHGTTTITGGDEDTSGDEDALAACSVHPASASGDHSMQASCSYADRFGDSCAITNFYACDNHVHFINTALLMGACGRHWVPSRLLSAHSLQASCSTINSNGDSCTVTSFYACYNHTHTYPAP